MVIYDTIIIGSGQAGLSTAYFLNKSPINYLILDDKNKAGGSWLDTWENLKLFSPTQYSSLSGWQMPESKNEYPCRQEFIDYLKAYEKRYNFSIQRNTKVTKVKNKDGIFKIETNQGNFYAETVVSATGTAKNPFIPSFPKRKDYQGVQLHSVDYRNTKKFKGKKILVIGGGNSGAQILAELSKVAQTKWVTLEEPTFLPEEIDGRYLFQQANSSYFNEKKQSEEKEVSLSDIVQVEIVKNGLKRNIYDALRPFDSFYKDGVIWQDGEKETFDAVIWCTGFNANLKHLNPLGIIKNGHIETKNTRSIKYPKLWLVGYGNWTGFASATIYGVGKTARNTAKEIKAHFDV